MKHLLKLSDCSKDEILDILNLADQLKYEQKHGIAHKRLEGQTLDVYKRQAKGFINATDCADYLTKKGVPFRDAYKITGTLVAKCIDQNCTMETLPLAEYQKLSDAFEDDVYDAINLTTCAFTRNCIGGPAKERVKEQIAAVKAAL